MTEYPLKDILNNRRNDLRGKKIALCITASASIYKCPEIARELIKFGAQVFVIISEKAQELISPKLMEWASGNTVITKITGKIEHIYYTAFKNDKVDLILISPATANTISKISNGISDNIITTLVSSALGSKIPIIIVPAMHEQLFNNPIIQDNIKKLVNLGIYFVGPRLEEGKAKMAKITDIIESVIRNLSIKDMKGMKILVTAGPTSEYIDPIRIITNKSSGKMGFALAKEALKRGAKVTLITGSSSIAPFSDIRVIKIETSDELFNSTVSELKYGNYDVYISSSAVIDFRPEKKYDYKISSDINEINIKLRPIPKIITKVRELFPKLFLVAFKAEYGSSEEELINSAYGLLIKSDLNLVIANDVSKKEVGFGSDLNEVFIITKNRTINHIPLSSKQNIANKILDSILKYYND